MTKDYQELLIPAGKTYAEGIEYYKALFSTDLTNYLEDPDYTKEEWLLKSSDPFILNDLDENNSDYPYRRDYYACDYELYKPIDAQLMAQINKEGNLALPKQLEELYTNFGTPSFGDYESGRLQILGAALSDIFYDIMSSWDIDDLILNSTDISKETLVEIKKRFFFFGAIKSVYCSEGSLSLLYYDRKYARYSELFVNYEENDCLEEDVLALLDMGENSGYASLDEVLCYEINEMIENILSQLELIS